MQIFVGVIIKKFNFAFSFFMMIYSHLIDNKATKTL